MARPIKPTPELDVESAAAFLCKVQMGLQTPSKKIETPKINKTFIDKIMADAKKRRMEIMSELKDLNFMMGIPSKDKSK